MKPLRSATKLQHCFWAIMSALSILGATQVSFAAAISGSMQEPFDYLAGTLFSNPSTLNGGQGWNPSGSSADPNAAGAVWGSFQNGGAAAGTFRTATSPGLTYAATGYLPASGNRLTLDATSATQNTGRTLGGQTIDAGTTYFSLLMSKNNDTIRTMNWAFFNGNTERFAIGQIGATAGNSAGNIALLMNNSNPAGLIQNGTSPIAMGVGVTHLLIGRIDWNAIGGTNEMVSLWVDPTDVTTEGAAGSVYVSTSAFELTAITGVRPFAGNAATVGGNPVTGISANFDEFRLGGTWESVTSLAVVPEPSTAALAAVAGLMLCLGRNRK